MAVILADTDVLIDYLAGVSPVAEQMIAYLGEERVTTTVINCFELLSGAREDSRGDRIRQFVENPTFSSALTARRCEMPGIFGMPL